MIQAFWEVLKDLWHFAFGLSGHNNNTVPPVQRTKDPSLQVVEVVNKMENSLSGVIIPTHKVAQSLGRVAYVQSDTAICMSSPKFTFDTQVGSLSYGDKVMVTRVQDSFAEIDTNVVRGWVETKVLSDDVHKVFPDLQSNQIYGFNNEQTIKLRRYLHDETLAQLLMLPLQSTEYLLYTLKRAGVTVSWPPTRPREPGAWQKILRGVKGVTMGIEPRTSSIFEYVGYGAPGFLGYVEAVHPDQSITLQSVGRINEGEYRVEEFTHDEWKEWRPVFISFV